MLIEHNTIRKLEGILNEWDEELEQIVKSLDSFILSKVNIGLARKIKDYFSSNQVIEVGLSKDQSDNLIAYIKAVPVEVAVDFWHIFSRSCPKLSDLWYYKTPGASELILPLVRNPEGKKVLNLWSSGV